MSASIASAALCVGRLLQVIQRSGARSMGRVVAVALCVATLPAAETPADTLVVTVHKSVVVDAKPGVQRIAVGNEDLAEAVAVSPGEVLLNGKSVGETSLLLWTTDGKRRAYDVSIRPNLSRLQAAQKQLQDEVRGDKITLQFDGHDLILQGTAADQMNAERAVALASSVGKLVNLLRVAVPAGDPQILLKVRFASVDRSLSNKLGANLFGTPNGKMYGATSTGQFGGNPLYQYGVDGTSVTLSDALNIFLFRPDLNFGAALQMLQARNLAQVLAEPNLLTTSGHAASFLAGGQFPFPTLQGGGAGVGQITIQFREFGIRLNFTPTVTLRGTIRLDVEPEVSSLDTANGLTVSGYTIPGLDVRRVQTQVELMNGQSLVIAGLLDNQAREVLSKVPGLANVPVLGKLFQSRSLQKNNSELLVIVTPQIVEPIPVDASVPDVKMPQPPIKGTATQAPQNPQPAHPPVLPKVESLPFVMPKEATVTVDPTASKGGGK